jgi:glycosyltransferase involved in cell wall biosynthesis
LSELKKITILSFDLSDNSLGRAYILGQALSDHYEVKIFGPALKGNIWEPLRNSHIPIVILPYSRFPLLLFKLPSILKEIKGDLIYAVKPRFTSFGFGLLKKIFSKTPLILDIDDWEVGFYLKKGFLIRLSRFIHVFNPNGFFWTWVLQFLIHYADKITTVSTFLKGKYGGEIIIHGKDTDLLDPERFITDDLKRQLGLAGKKIIMFLGTPREHKGVEDALKAVLMIDAPDLLMIIVGANLKGDYEKRLKTLGRDRLLMIGPVHFNEVPRYLMLADIVVVPQRRTPDTIGQIPSKLLDAMSMAKTIISTRVSDIPEILNDCGIVVDPDSPEELCEAIRKVIYNQEKATQMGLKAREKCMKQFSLNAIRERLHHIIGKII